MVHGGYSGVVGELEGKTLWDGACDGDELEDVEGNGLGEVERLGKRDTQVAGKEGNLFEMLGCSNSGW